MRVFRKKETPPVRGKDISGPTMVKHEGHFGFSDQGFSVRNLPPEWAALFTGINQELKNMGQKGITKREAKFLLKEFAKRMPPTVPEDSNPISPRPSPRPNSPTRGGLSGSTGSNTKQKFDPKAECEQLKLMIRNMEEMHRLERKKWMSQQSATELGAPSSGVGLLGVSGKVDEEKIKKLKEEKSKLESNVHQLKCEYDSLQAQILALQTELNLLRSEKQILSTNPSAPGSAQEIEKLRVQVVNYSSQLTTIRTTMETALQRTQERLEQEAQKREELSEELSLLKRQTQVYTTLITGYQVSDDPLSPRSGSAPAYAPPAAAPPPPPPPAPAPPPPPPGNAGSNRPPPPVPRSQPPPPSSGGGDSRNALLDAIKNPERQLKKVEPIEAKPEPEEEGMLGALTRALLDRRAAIRDGDEDEDDDDEVDWD